MDLLTVAIGVGLAMSLLFSELFGLAAGGMVVPGYFAIALDSPARVVVTIGAAVVAYGIVHALSSVMIIYGKRRTVMMILFGFLAGMAVRLLPLESVQTFETIEGISAAEVPDYSVIGYIIPGLLAIWIDRQGLIETISTLIMASIAVRMVLICCGVEGLG